MQKPFWLKLAPLVLAGALALSGCGGAKKAEDTQPAIAEAQQTKPQLVIPKAFENTAAKQNFAINAVKDHYFAEANPLLEEVVKESPTAAGYVALGTTRYQLGNYAGAVEAWTKAMELDPSLAGEMHNNTGNALREQGKIEDAMTAYTKALQIDPTRWTAAVNMAGILKDQGKLAEAVAVLENAAPANKESLDLQHLLKSYRQELEAVANG